MMSEDIKAESAADEKPQVEAKAVEKNPSGTAPLQLEVGAKYKGRVRSVVDFGAFIDIGAGRDGLLHVSALKRAGMDKTVSVGDTIEVIVRRVEPGDNRISLALPGSDVETKSNKLTLNDLKVGSTVTGKVVRLADFGAFVDIGAQSDGLLHVSELPWGYVNKPSEVLKIGDEVEVLIVEVDARRQRISLSMRQVQATIEQEPAAEEQSNEPLPTAFELAFQKARQKQRRPQASSRR
ncbi:MAG: S1 RNA-binding domain-containing protein [Anaerolineae bacterium]